MQLAGVRAVGILDEDPLNFPIPFSISKGQQSWHDDLLQAGSVDLMMVMANLFLKLMLKREEKRQYSDTYTEINKI